MSQNFVLPVIYVTRLQRKIRNFGRFQSASSKFNSNLTFISFLLRQSTEVERKVSNLKTRGSTRKLQTETINPQPISFNQISRSNSIHSLDQFNSNQSILIQSASLS